MTEDPRRQDSSYFAPDTTGLRLSKIESRIDDLERQVLVLKNEVCEEIKKLRNEIKGQRYL